jgi:hypothetical protein
VERRLTEDGVGSGRNDTVLTDSLGSDGATSRPLATSALIVGP